MGKKYYIDTNVFGGYYEDEFSEWTQPFFKHIIETKSKIVYSNISIRELERAPLNVRNLLTEIIPEECREYVLANEKTYELAKAYIDEKVLGKSSFADAEHIAIASFYSVNCIVSWNFKHVVNIAKMKGYKKVNQRFGFQIINIKDPKTILLNNDF